METNLKAELVKRFSLSKYVYKSTNPCNGRHRHSDAALYARSGGAVVFAEIIKASFKRKSRKRPRPVSARTLRKNSVHVFKKEHWDIKEDPGVCS